MDGKLIATDYTAKICKQLGADGVIISEEGYGNPDSDLVMICERLEKSGIKTVLITDECSGWDGKRVNRLQMQKKKLLLLYLLEM